MMHGTPCAAIADRVQDLLNAAPIAPAYRTALLKALTLPGNILSASSNARWARLVWTCCAAVGGQWERAVPAAAAIELFMVALDVLDDQEDDEDTRLKADLGAACALNVSTGLLFLAQQGLMDSADGEQAAGILLQSGLRACSGQHADLAAGPDRSTNLEEALTVTAGKSASLVAAACRLGALAGGADARMQELYARFGWYLGMVEQLINDITAIRPDATGKTDIALGRPTLPLAYAASQSVPDACGSDANTRAALWTGGAAYLTWAVAETYRRHALGMIPQLTSNPIICAALAALVPVLS